MSRHYIYLIYINSLVHCICIIYSNFIPNSLICIDLTNYCILISASNSLLLSNKDNLLINPRIFYELYLLCYSKNSEASKILFLLSLINILLKVTFFMIYISSSRVILLIILCPSMILIFLTMLIPFRTPHQIPYVIHRL